MDRPVKTPDLPELAEVRSAGLLLCTKLREVGIRVSSMQSDVTRLADKVQLHWRVLDQLSQRLSSSDSVHNDRAITLLKAILDCSTDVFKVIGTITPTKDSQSFTYSLIVRQRMKAMVKKTPMDTLLRRLEFLYRAAELVATVLQIGEKVRWSRIFGRGRPTDQVVYETTRLNDRPAKNCLSDSVLQTLKAYTDECDGVTTLLPFVPFEASRERRGSHDEQKFVSENMEVWWSLLLTEWTNVDDRSVEEKTLKDLKAQDKKQRAAAAASSSSTAMTPRRSPPGKVASMAMPPIPFDMIEEDEIVPMPQAIHPPRLSSLNETAVY